MHEVKEKQYHSLQCQQKNTKVKIVRLCYKQISNDNEAARAPHSNQELSLCTEGWRHELITGYPNVHSHWAHSHRSSLYFLIVKELPSINSAKKGMDSGNNTI